MDDRDESYRLAKALAAKQTPLTAAERGNLLRFMQLDAAKYKPAQTAQTAQPAQTAQTAQPTSKTADALQALKAGKPLTNSQAESILASPEAMQQLRSAGIQLDLEGKTKAAQRAELKAISGTPEAQSIQAMSLSGAQPAQNGTFVETANDTAKSQNVSQKPSQPQETQAALSPTYQWLGDAKKSGEGQSRSLSDLRKFTESKLKLTVAEKEMFMRSAIGEFMVKSENVHVRQTNDLPVLAHEAGHAMDKRFSLLKKADPVVRSELERNLSPAMKQAYPAQLFLMECR